MSRNLTCSAIFAAALLGPTPAVAAESYDNCAGFITSLPATITAPGIWCLDRDLSTAITSGIAVTVNANNVTIECNRFRIGGLQAGPGTSAFGIAAESRLNTTIRNCSIRGFLGGIVLDAGSGHLVEGNRLDGNTNVGIFVNGFGSIIRDNQVIDTGGSTFTPSEASGIHAINGVDVIGNTVSGVAPAGTDAAAQGIYTFNNGKGTVSGNRVRGLVPQGAGTAFGIRNLVSGQILIRDNLLQGPGEPSIAIACTNNRATTENNLIVGFVGGVVNCYSVSNTENPNP